MADPTDREGGGTSRAIGRSEVPEAIDRALTDAAGGTGRGLLLRGAAGIGKSQFLRVAIARARERGFLVASGHGLPDELPAPFALVREWVASLESDEGPAEPFAEGAGPILPQLPGRETQGPDGGAPARSTPANDDLERILAPRGRTAVEGLGASRSRLISALSEFVLGRAQAAPLLLAIDDLAFADRSSLDFLEHLARELAGTRIALVATVGEEAELPAAVRATVSAIAGAPAFRSVVVRTMTVPEVAEFATLLLDGNAPSPDDVQRWHAETGGNPLFVEQMVQSTLGRVGSLPATGSVPGKNLAALLLQRAQSLDDTEHRVLTYAAVLGREFDFDRLHAVVGLEEDRLTEALDRLVHAGLVRERPGEVYEFVSEAVRASVYAGLTETRRRILHGKVALALEARGGAGDFELARQFYLGRNDTKTIEYNLRAAESAARSYAFDAAVSHLARALEADRRRSDRDPRFEVRLLTEQGRLLHEAGDLTQAEEVLRRAVEQGRALPPDGAELGRALVAYAWTRVDRSDYRSAEKLATEAIDRLADHGTPRDLFSAHRVLGTAYWRTGDVPRTEEHARAALEIANREGTAIERGHALVDVANALFPLGRVQFDTALSLYDRAAELFATAGDPASQARVMMNRAVLEYSVGKRTEAFADIIVALEAAERSRSPLWIGFCLMNFAQWKAEEGDLPTARAAIDRAARTVAPLGDRLSDQQIGMIRGMIAEGEGFYDEAELRYQESLALARKLDLASEASEDLYRLAHLALRRDDRALARTRAAEARANGLATQRPDLLPQLEEIEAAVGARR